MAEVVKLHGLDDVRRALRRLPKEIRDKELQKALRPGARIIANAAKALAPRGEGFYRQFRGKTWVHYKGTLARSIVIRREGKRYLRDAAKLKIGVLHSQRDPNIGAWYWRFVEFGTHKMPAKPFMVPAFESMKYAANKAITDALRKAVFKQAAKVKR